MHGFRQLHHVANVFTQFHRQAIWLVLVPL